MQKRKPLTRSQLAELVLTQMGKCAKCSERLDFASKGKVVDEHIVPIFSTPPGVDPNRTENRALFCKPCATVKTSAEAPDRAKVRRIEGGKTQADRREKAKAEGHHRKMGMREWPKGRKIQSRGFARAALAKETP